MGVTDALAALGSEPTFPLDPVSPWAFRSTLGRGVGDRPRRDCSGVLGQSQRNSEGGPPSSLGEEGDRF